MNTKKTAPVASQARDRENPVQTSGDVNPVECACFIHSKLDDAGLTLSEFRVLGHIARRSGSEAGCFAAIGSIASICRLSINTTRKALKALAARNFIRLQHRDGATTAYHITPMSDWHPYQKLVPLPKIGTPTKRGEGSPTKIWEGTPTKRDPLRLSTEGNPSKVIQKKAASPAVVIPDALIVSPDFIETWGTWLEHLRQKRKPATAHACELQLQKLAAMGPSAAVATLKHCIEKNWQGIYPIRNSVGSAPATLTVHTETKKFRTEQIDPRKI